MVLDGLDQVTDGQDVGGVAVRGLEDDPLRTAVDHVEVLGAERRDGVGILIDGVVADEVGGGTFRGGGAGCGSRHEVDVGMFGEDCRCVRGSAEPLGIGNGDAECRGQLGMQIEDAGQCVRSALELHGDGGRCRFHSMIRMCGSATRDPGGTIVCAGGSWAVDDVGRSIGQLVRGVSARWCLALEFLWMMGPSVRPPSSVSTEPSSSAGSS